MRIAISENTFNKIVEQFKKIKEFDIVNELNEARLKFENSLTQSKRDAGRISGQINSGKKKALVEAAYKMLEEKGEKITAKKIEKEAAVSYSTARKYLAQINNTFKK